MHLRRSRFLAPLAASLALAVAGCGDNPGDNNGSEDATSKPAAGSPSAPQVQVDVSPAPAAGEGDADAPASIRGVVHFEGEPPAREPLAITSTKGCEHDGPPPLTEAVIVNDGRLQNCIVYVSKGLSDHQAPPPPEEPVRLDQRGCVYRPHVSALRAGQKLVVHNNDPSSHNVHVYAQRTTVPNRTQPAGGQDLEIVFEKAEPPVTLGCDIHPWMRAHVGVFDHPFFAVTGEDGSFRIDGLPPGKYTLTCWHEKYEKRTTELDLPAGGTARVDFTVSAK